MTEEWRALPIPMLPANERSRNSGFGGDQNPVKTEVPVSTDERRTALDLAQSRSNGRAKAERDAMEMMERAKAMLRNA